MSEEFTNDAQEQALLQGPKARVFLKSLLKLFAFCDELECVPTNLPVTLSVLGGPNESPPELSTYKQQERYLCVDHAFDNKDDNDDDANDSIVDEEAKRLWLSHVFDHDFDNIDDNHDDDNGSIVDKQVDDDVDDDDNVSITDNDYNPFDASKCLQHQSRKRKMPPITYDDDDDHVFSLPREQHADHHHTTCRLRRPPKFISCPNGTLF